jgi:CheY-like chemotaxis protein
MSRFSSVLLLDDNEDDNYIHERYIQRAHWADEVLVFTEAEKALSYLVSHLQLPQVMLVDVNMPVMTGFQLLDKLCEAGVDLSSVAIVMVTSSLHPDDCRRAANHPLVSDYINKPINSEVLEALAIRLEAQKRQSADTP